MSNLVRFGVSLEKGLLEKFDALIAEARKQARRSGLRQSDVAKAIARVRRAR